MNIENLIKLSFIMGRENNNKKKSLVITFQANLVSKALLKETKFLIPIPP